MWWIWDVAQSKGKEFSWAGIFFSLRWTSVNLLKARECTNSMLTISSTTKCYICMHRLFLPSFFTTLFQLHIYGRVFQMSWKKDRPPVNLRQKSWRSGRWSMLGSWGAVKEPIPMQLRSDQSGRPCMAFGRRDFAKWRSTVWDWYRFTGWWDRSHLFVVSNYKL